MKNPVNLTRIQVAKALEELKDKAARIKADGLPNIASRMKRPDLTALRERAAQLKLPAIKVPDLKLRDLKLPEFKRPGTAAGFERLKAARDGVARHVKRASESIPRALDEIAPRAKDIADRIADAVPKRALKPLDDSAAIAKPQQEARPSARAVVDKPRRAAIDQPPLLIRLLPLLLALVGAGVIHILATFAVPVLGTGSAWNRLARLVPTANRMTILAAPTPANQPLPFLAPDMRYAICRYDLALGPVLVNATLPDVGWSLTLYAPNGDNYYAVPAQELRQTALAFQINAASDRLLQLSPGVRKADVDLSQVTSPGREGLVVIRAPIKGVAHHVETERVLRQASCQQARPN